MMWVSLAGPISNFLMALIAAIPFQLGLVSGFEALTYQGTVLPTLDYLLYEFVYINLLLMLFNLIPIAPLDGEKVLSYLAPPSLARVLDTIRPYGPMLLLLLVLAGSFAGFNLLWTILGPPLQALLGLLVG
jgi:Zn-dependent protease